jgi:hypothetical protein
MQYPLILDTFLILVILGDPGADVILGDPGDPGAGRVLVDQMRNAATTVVQL